MSNKVAAIVTAAGASRRMEGPDKVFAPLAGLPILAHVLRTFQDHPSVDTVVLVVNQANLQSGRDLVDHHQLTKVAAVLPGGDRRQDSVFNGLKSLTDCDWAIIHDGARPCLTPDIIDRGLAEARTTGAAIAAVPAKDTIKRVDAGNLIVETPPRQSLWLAQTPQIFKFDIIFEAYHKGAHLDATDDAALVEALGHKVKVYMGSYDNIKITTPEDLALAETILARRK